MGGVTRHGSDGAEERIEATFRNGSLTAVSVVLGFSLSFFNRWAGLPGSWTRSDLLAVLAISLGVTLQIVAVARMLGVRSLLLRHYNRSVRIFLVGLAWVAVGVALAVGAELLGFGQNVVRG